MQPLACSGPVARRPSGLIEGPVPILNRSFVQWLRLSSGKSIWKHRYASGVGMQHGPQWSLNLFTFQSLEILFCLLHVAHLKMFDSLCIRPPQQLAIHEEPPCWRAKVALGQDKQKKLPFKIIYAFYCDFCSPAWQFVPGEWLAAKGSCLSFYRTQNTKEDVYSRVVLIPCMYVNLLGTESLGFRSTSELHIGVNSGLKYLSEESIACSRGSGGGE